jgi:hypothetical protein
MTFGRSAWLAILGVAGGVIAPLAMAQSLDFQTYKTQVEPIFNKKRPGHARCVACHSAANNSFRLQPVAEGASWTDEQSRQNFAVVSKLVTPGNPTSSKLLIHPLAQEAGGDEFHSGGRQFTSKDDPDWKAIANWVGKSK